MAEHDPLSRVVSAAARQPVFVWGAGRAGINAVRRLRDAGVEPVAFVDSSPRFDRERVEGLRVLLPAALTTQVDGGDEPFVVIASLYARDIEASAEALGVPARARCVFTVPVEAYPGVTDPLRPDFYALLHELRGHLLADMPRPVETMLSAGCSGRWYFDWIEERYGHVPRHIGAEMFQPRPASLPDNVVWLARDVSHVPEVSDGSVDLLFSGQNIEHLWPSQALGFLRESSRVLKHGGWLVLDSPNRELTRRLNWTNGEHTIEYSLDDIIELLTLSGFDDVSVKGVWLCRDATGVLPLSPFESATPDAMLVLRRAALARERPEDSFVWWAEARKRRPADVGALSRRLEEMFDSAWPERLDRFIPGAQVVSLRGERWVQLPGPGLLADGPHFPLAPGRHTLRMRVRGRRTSLRIDLLQGLADRQTIVTSATITVDDGEGEVTLPVELAEMQSGFHLVCRCLGPGPGELLLHCAHERES